jgi:oxygen-independent coproporphyrinogen-3 oxidase
LTRSIASRQRIDHADGSAPLPFAERQAPRYTSYPSASHFDASVDAGLYRRWLSALDNATSLSLYLHVPYCRQLCWYCGCNTFLTRGGDIGDFVTTLMMEMDLVASALGSRTVNEVHWGGGTPNVLSAAEFLRIVHHIDFWFDVRPDVKHAIELDPRYITPELAQAYAAAGVGRVSLGVQDLNTHVQEAIGRIQPFDQVREGVRILREAELKEISFDLMYGLPRQSAGDLAPRSGSRQVEPNHRALWLCARALVQAPSAAHRCRRCGTQTNASTRPNWRAECSMTSAI